MVQCPVSLDINRGFLSPLFALLLYLHTTIVNQIPFYAYQKYNPLSFYLIFLALEFHNGNHSDLVAVIGCRCYFVAIYLNPIFYFCRGYFDHLVTTGVTQTQ